MIDVERRGKAGVKTKQQNAENKSRKRLFSSTISRTSSYFNSHLISTQFMYTDWLPAKWAEAGLFLGLSYEAEDAASAHDDVLDDDDGVCGVCLTI